MIAKNTLSIAASNFSIIFKVMVFALVLVLLFAAVFTGVLSPIISELGKALDIEISFEGTTPSVGEMGNGTLSGLFEDLWLRAKSFFEANQSVLWFSFTMLLLTLFFIRFFIGIILLPISKYFANKLTTGYSDKLYRTFITIAGKAVVTSFLSSLIFLVCDLGISALIIFLCFLSFRVFGIFAFYIAVILLIALLSMRTALTAMWLPRMAINGDKPLTALKLTLRDTKKTFKKTFAGTLALSIFTVLFGAATVPFTLGLSFVIIIPMVIVLYIIMTLVQYCHFYGQNYFKDEQTIIKVGDALHTVNVQSELEVETISEDILNAVGDIKNTLNADKLNDVKDEELAK